MTDEALQTTTAATAKPRRERRSRPAAEELASSEAAAAPADGTAELALPPAADRLPAPAGVPQGSKLDRLLTLLMREGGASLVELCDASGWQEHSVRGALAGALKRKGHVVLSEKTDGVRRYRVAAAAPQPAP